MRDGTKRNDGLKIILVIAALAVLLVGALLVFAFLRQGANEGCVGVLEVNGELVTQSSDASLFSEGVVGSQEIAAQIEDANNSQNIKSLLVVINSPGGGVVASKEIYDALKGFSRPKVSYIYEVGASGGYMVAAGTDYIVANPDAITGSIGVRATFIDMSGLFGKLGLNETTIKSGEMKDVGTSTRPITEAERAMLMSIVQENFDEFKGIVKQSRAGKLDAVLFEEALDARWLSGRQAKRIGLVDATGDRKAALRKAVELAGIKDEKVCAIGGMKKKGLLDMFASDATGALRGFSLGIYPQKKVSLEY